MRSTDTLEDEATLVDAVIERVDFEKALSMTLMERSDYVRDIFFQVQAAA